MVIIVSSEDKSTTIRLKEQTKKMLEAKAKGKETHEEIILRLINMADTISGENGTNIIQRGNVVGTKYAQLHKTFDISLEKKKYKVVGTYNDLSPIALMKQPTLDWEVDFKLININKGNKWESPSNLPRKEHKLLHMICLKQILEESFHIQLYQLSNTDDYLNIDKWNDAYNKNGLSKDSFNMDIKKELR